MRLMQVQIIPPQYIVKGNIIHREKTSPYGAGFAFRVNGLDNAGAKGKIAGACVGFCGGKEHCVSHDQFPDQQAVPHLIDQCLTACGEQFGLRSQQGLCLPVK